VTEEWKIKIGRERQKEVKERDIRKEGEIYRDRQIGKGI
jgi:hypothetical protein